MFVIGILDIIRIPHAPNWRQILWTLKYGLGSTTFPWSFKLSLLVRQVKTLFTFMFVGPLWLLDELLFSYRSAELPQMVFIICTPRTGSTNLHRIMARDPRVIAPTLADLLSPFLCTQMLCRLIGRPDLPAKLVNKLVLMLNGGGYSDIHTYHDTGVDVVEELGIMTLSQWFSEMIMPPYFHPDLLKHYPIPEFPEYLRQRILDYAALAIRRFAYMHRTKETKMVVCKAIEPFLFQVPELQKRFPNAKFITLTRDPKKQICSRFSFYSAQMKASHNYDCDKKEWGNIISTRTRDAVEFVMQHFFRESHSNRLGLTFKEFVGDLSATYSVIYKFLGFGYKGTPFEQIVKDEIEEHKKFKGKRKYSNVKFEDFGIDETKFSEMFAEYNTYCEPKKGKKTRA